MITLWFGLFLRSVIFGSPVVLHLMGKLVYTLCNEPNRRRALPVYRYLLGRASSRVRVDMELGGSMTIRRANHQKKRAPPSLRRAAVASDPNRHNFNDYPRESSSNLESWNSRIAKSIAKDQSIYNALSRERALVNT